jgi:hypothetical protein
MATVLQMSQQVRVHNIAPDHVYRTFSKHHVCRHKHEAGLPRASSSQAISLCTGIITTGPEVTSHALALVYCWPQPKPEPKPKVHLDYNDTHASQASVFNSSHEMGSLVCLFPGMNSSTACITPAQRIRPATQSAAGHDHAVKSLQSPQRDRVS